MKTLFLLLNAGKLGKALLTSGTMILSVITYSFVFGWPYAVGIVALIFCHEMGHYMAARQRGLDVGAPTFIPFVGAWIQLKQLPHDVETEAYIGLAGPVMGTLSAFLCYYVARAQESDLLLALAYSGFMINLFNLLPISPLDGGRITAIISPKVWLLGAPLLLGLFIWRPSPMLLLIALLAAPHVIAAWRGNLQQPPGYYDVPMQKRITYAIWYLGLAIILALMSFELHNHLRGTH